MAKPSIDLIVNADDYGYFPCVSQGIIEAAKAGAVSATGLLANGPDLAGQIPWLKELDRLDVGVHLNLTSRAPLTAAMAGRLEKTSGLFPGAFAMTGQVLAGQISLRLVREEWRAQIDTLIQQGLLLRFLNSHEHIHMLPGLFALAVDLAKEYGIPHVRFTRPEWLPPHRVSTVLRNLLLQGMGVLDRPRKIPGTPLFIGLSGSGQLDLACLQTLFGRLKPGRAYELMCHPGRFDPAQISDPRLLAYHAWETEWAALTSPQFKVLCESLGIRIINYRELQQVG